MTTTEMHDEAMRLIDENDLRGALELERQAAETETSEPSRSILHRSAAWMALETGASDEAIRLAAEGLRGADQKLAIELCDVILEALSDVILKALSDGHSPHLSKQAS